MAYTKPISKFEVADKFFADDYPHNAVKSYAYALFSADLADTQVIIGDITYEFVATLSNPVEPYEIIRTGVAATDASNFALAINGGERTQGSEEYSDGTIAHPLVEAVHVEGETTVLVQAKKAGVEGDMIGVASGDVKIAFEDAEADGSAVAELTGGRLATPAPYAIAYIPDPKIAPNTIVMTTEPVDVQDTDKWKTYVLA